MCPKVKPYGSWIKDGCISASHHITSRHVTSHHIIPFPRVKTGPETTILSVINHGMIVIIHVLNQEKRGGGIFGDQNRWESTIFLKGIILLGLKVLANDFPLKRKFDAFPSLFRTKQRGVSVRLRYRLHLKWDTFRGISIYCLISVVWLVFIEHSKRY